MSVDTCPICGARGARRRYAATWWHVADDRRIHLWEGFGWRDVFPVWYRNVIERFDAR